MRDLEEYKREIFKRSEDRINERERQRKKILAIMTLSLFFIFASVPFLLLMNNRNYMSIELSQKGINEEYFLYGEEYVTQDDRVEAVWEYITKAFSDYSGGGYGGYVGSGETEKTEYCGSYDIMITVYNRGYISRYVIDGNYLVDTDLDWKRKLLTDEEKSEILRLLGVQKGD